MLAADEVAVYVREAEEANARVRVLEQALRLQRGQAAEEAAVRAEARQQELEQRLAAMERDLAAREEAAQEQEAAYTRLERECMTLRSQVQEYRESGGVGSGSGSGAQLQQLRQENAALLDYVQDTRERLQGHEQGKQELQAQLKMSEEARGSLSRDVQRLQRELRAAVEACAEGEAAGEQQREVVARVKGENEALSGELQRSEDALRGAQQEINDLREMQVWCDMGDEGWGMRSMT